MFVFWLTFIRHPKRWKRLPWWLVKNPLVMQENTCNAEDTWVRFLGWEDLLEKELATRSSILAWKIPQRSLACYSPWGHKESDTSEHTHTTIFCFLHLLLVGGLVTKSCPTL